MVIPEITSINVPSEFLSRGFLIQKCSGYLDFKLLNAHQYDLWTLGSNNWVDQADAYGSPTGCQIMTAHGAKYLGIYVDENGSSGEITIASDFWSIKDWHVWLYLVVPVVIALYYLKKARGQLVKADSDDSFKPQPKVVEKAPVSHNYKSYKT